MLFSLFVFALVFVLGGGGWGYSRYGKAVGAGPLGIMALLLLSLYLTGNLPA